MYALYYFTFLSIILTKTVNNALVDFQIFKCDLHRGLLVRKRVWFDITSDSIKNIHFMPE